MIGRNGSFLSTVGAWLQREPSVESAVLFGSSARGDGKRPVERWSDFDLHIITRAPDELERVDWTRTLPAADFRFQTVRPATGGMRKVTAIFAAAQLDLIIVPSASARLVKWIYRLGLHRSMRSAQTALNEWATCLHTGYRFLKGEDRWGAFYREVARTMTGVRLTDEEVRQLADTFLVDALWVLQKIERGELMAAQHVLHRQLSETNLRLYRELRLKRGQSLPSFGLGRRVEALATPAELSWLRIESALDSASLRTATLTALAGLQSIIRELELTWSMPPAMHQLIVPAAITPAP